jgi:hypothetical protein
MANFATGKIYGQFEQANLYNAPAPKGSWLIKPSVKSLTLTYKGTKQLLNLIPVSGTIIGGRILDDNGNNLVELIATTQPNVEPLNFTYTIFFELEEGEMKPITFTLTPKEIKNIFSGLPIPVIEDVQDDETSFTITGVNFGENQGIVYVNDIEAEVLGWGDTTILAKGALKNGDLIVAETSEGEVSNAFIFFKEYLRETSGLLFTTTAQLPEKLGNTVIVPRSQTTIPTQISFQNNLVQLLSTNMASNGMIGKVIAYQEEGDMLTIETESLNKWFDDVTDELDGGNI